jgi:hypothetical protein
VTGVRLWPSALHRDVWDVSNWGMVHRFSARRIASKWLTLPQILEDVNCIVKVEAPEKWHAVNEDIRSSRKPLCILVQAFFVTASPDHGLIDREM